MKLWQLVLVLGILMSGAALLVVWAGGVFYWELPYK